MSNCSERFETRRRRNDEERRDDWIESMIERAQSFHLHRAVRTRSSMLKTRQRPHGMKDNSFDSTIELRFCIFDRWSDRSKCSYFETGLELRRTDRRWWCHIPLRDVIFRNIFDSTSSTSLSKPMLIDANAGMWWPYTRSFYIFHLVGRKENRMLQ